MPGPMDPRTDKTARWIFLDKLRRSLMPYTYEQLDLVNLQPLRDEVDAELQAVHGPKQPTVPSDGEVTGETLPLHGP